MSGSQDDAEPTYQAFAKSVIDPETPNVARMYNYYLGGNDWFDSDRAAAEEVIASVPLVREMARHNRHFLRRCVRFLARECGIRQFLDVGTGLPSEGNVHEVAREVDPDVRVVYVDNDPVVLAHARRLRVPSDNVTVITADVREPRTILRSSDVRELIDFTEPVAVLFIAILHFITDDDNPHDILGIFRETVPPGSYIAITHIENDPRNQAGARVYERTNVPAVLRTRAEISHLFDGFQLVDPGVVPISQWHPDSDTPGSELPFLGGVGRKSQ
jgi:hypothetical protein